MKIYFDENFSPKLAQGLAVLQSGNDRTIEVLHIQDAFGKGTPDETWIPVIAKEQGVVLTQDLNIHRKQQQWALCEKHGLRIVFFKPPKKHRPTY